MSDLECPSRDDLIAFAVGKLPDDRRDALAVHVDSCSDCQQELATVGETNDTLLAGLRQPVGANQFEEESALIGALARVEQIGREPSFTRALASTNPDEQAADELELGTLGSYRLIAKIGQGGMGAVYKALHTHLEKVVAVKVLPPDRMKDSAAVARFRREMRVVGKLEHPNLVRAFDAGEIDGKHFLVMEYVEGENLSAISRRCGPLPIADACELIRQAAVGLEYAHEHGLVHRDIKPSNVMLSVAVSLRERVSASLAASAGQPDARSRSDAATVKATVKILDLGLALLSEARASQAGDLTDTGHIMGTIDYMSPEQASDSHAVDIRADVYSLGATLYALLTGRSVFHDRPHLSLTQKLTALVTEEVPPIRDRRGDIPQELAAIVHRMLARKPAERFATPADVVAALAPFADGADLPALADAAVEKAPKTARVDPTKVATDPYLSRPSTGTEVTSDQPSDALQKPPSASRADERPGDPTVIPVWNESPTLPLGEEPGVRARAGSTVGRFRRRVAIAVAAGIAGIVVLAAILVSLRTPYGEVVVELPDDAPAEWAEQLKVEVRGNGDVKVADAESGWTIDVKKGKYEVQLAGGDDRFAIEENSVTVTRGKKTFVRVTLKPAGVAAAKPAVWQPTPEQQAFFDAVALVGARQQAAAIERKLMEVNPRWDGGIGHSIDTETLTHVELSGGALRDLWPLAALTGLVELDCSGTSVETIGWIERMPLVTSLNCSQTPLRDLGPVAHLNQLEKLDCSDTVVFDLSPLAGLPLKELHCFTVSTYNDGAIKVLKSLPQLETINGLTLSELEARRKEIDELLRTRPAFTAEEHLARVVDKLKEFNPAYDGKVQERTIEGGRVVQVALSEGPLKDPSPLRALPALKHLHCAYNEVSDLSPLAGLPLTNLNVCRTRISDLSPLAGVPMAHLTINNTAVSDLSPLKGVPLAYLDCNGTKVSDLSPLKGIVLTTLLCSDTQVSDLSPLAGMPLTHLHCVGARVSDLAPLSATPIAEIHCDESLARKSAPVLKEIVTLKTINGQPAAEFWKE